ncbi:MAG: response regulator transcription factor [Thermodesulfobacteriota bacterium]
MMENEVKVLLVDDHLLVRYGLKAMLERIDGFVCVAEADNGREGISLAREHEPDVVVLDIDLGKGMNGFDVAEEIKATSPNSRILMLTGNPKPQFFQMAIQTGCAGYVLKVDSDQEFKQALETVAKGGKYLSRSFTDDVFQLLQQSNNLEGDNPENLLTPRENSIAHLICKGLNDDAIGEELCISPKTVRVHKSNIKRKFNCKTSGELILKLTSLDFG